jgi:hypothetical protein
MRGCVRTHQVRSNALWQDLHFKSTFLPFAHHVCCNDLHNTKYQKLYKMLVINAAKSLTNISKGGSNKQYLTPINAPKLILLVLPMFSNKFAFYLQKSRSWLVTITVQPTIHVLQTNCQLLLTYCLHVHVHFIHVCEAVAPPHSWKVIEL